MKTCSKCHEAKLMDSFYRASGTRDGRRGECIACTKAIRQEQYPLIRQQAIERTRKWQSENRERHLEAQRRRRSTPERRRKDRSIYLVRKYGITIEQYDEMLAQQHGGCAICSRPPRADISLHVDHDHETGRVRALLCFRCNNALGDFDDDRSRLLAAVELLDRTPDVEALVQMARARAAALAA